ncbi:unnamed protein product [Clonostachys byssicola]|uniref:Heterokaryon incompatibility domain-containing protein n=1 Tax=Clonostachys byssicola TaxID=160290 RepID=A0A9N9U5Y7_9HYPO|nr:unnamed protein product [Clonostachys byssicola]
MASQANTGQVLCENCQWIRLDDSLLDGFAGESEDGYSVLEFESGNQPKRFEVAYYYEDLLPDLPGLLQSHQNTQCTFCHYLREAILHAKIEKSGEISISVQYRWFIAQEMFSITHKDHENLSCVSVTLTSAQESWEKHLFFKVESSEVRVARWLGIHRCPESEVWCPKNIEWVQVLLKYTSNVGPSTTLRGLPTRLIDVGETWACSPRLVHTADLGQQHVRYCALSYCWGDAKDAETQLKTTKESISEFCLGIPESKMTQVMKDTVEVCRALNVRYMWIDALCIIQGDKDDWERESGQMSMVYGNAYLTLCALSSNSTHQTFLGRDTHIFEFNFESKIETSIRGRVQLSFRGNMFKTMHTDFFMSDPAVDLECAWSERGWTFQEDILAPRKLLFGRSMLYFQHGRCVYREDGEKVLNWQDKSFSNIVTNNIPESSYRAWNELLRGYDTREFTNQADALPAISGLARVFNKARQDTYLAGLWRKDILRGVLWATPKTEMDKTTLLRKLASPEIYIAPSWSNLRSRFPTVEGIGGWNFPYKETHVISEVVNLEASTCPDGLDPYGRIKSGALRMSARLKPVAEYRFLSGPHNGQMWITYDEEVYCATCNLDYQGQGNVLPGDGTALLFLSSACCANEPPRRFLYLSKTEMVSQLANAGYPDNYDGSLRSLSKEQRDSIGLHDILDESDSHLTKYRGANPNPCECYKSKQRTCRNSHDQCRACRHCKRCCTQPRRGINAHAWGLIVHPTGTPGQFYRVGVFTSRALGPNSSSGTNAFQGLPFEEVEII